jgi:putative DNA primase/helicase
LAFLNLSEAVGQMVAGGLRFDPKYPVIVGHHQFLRVAVDGRKGRPGWYKLFELNTEGGSLVCGVWGIAEGSSPGEVQKIVLTKSQTSLLTPAELQAANARVAEEKREKAAKAAARRSLLASRAASWWRKCSESGECLYLSRKGLPPGRLYGARLSPSGALMIPITDQSGKTWGCQVIYSDEATRSRKSRDKDYLPAGLEKRGLWFTIGSPSARGIAVVVEGFATGATIHEATGLPVIVAFDAPSLLPVALNVRKAYRDIRLLFAADDDYLQRCLSCGEYTRVCADAPTEANETCTHCGNQHGQRNAGIVAAQTAAVAVSGAVVWPVFPSERPLKVKGKCTDFNDLLQDPDGGTTEIRIQIEARLSSLGWISAKHQTPRGILDHQGAGEGIDAPPPRSNMSVEEAQDRYSYIYGARDLLFDHADHSLVPKSCVTDLLVDHGWRDWKRQGIRVHRLQDVGFDPGESDPSVLCNLYAGWPTAPKEGKCDRLLELLASMCNGEPNGREVYQWVLRWLAYPLQHVGAKLQTTLVWQGPQGTGKNLFFDTYRKIYGRYGGVIDQNAVEDKFNDYLSRKLFLAADEVVARSDLYRVKNMLKSLITAQRTRINSKQVSAWEEDNHANVVFLSNERLPVVIEADDRRYLVIWTPPPLSKQFYEECGKELAEGGQQALHHYLLHLDLGDFQPHSKPPMTKAKREVQALSSGSIERFFAEWVGRETQWTFCPASSAQLYLAYTRYCRENGERQRPQNDFSNYIGKQPGWKIGLGYVFQSLAYNGDPVKRRMVLPPDDLLKSEDKSQKDYRRKPDQKIGQWLTDCFFEFHSTLGGVD